MCLRPSAAPRYPAKVPEPPKGTAPGQAPCCQHRAPPTLPGQQQGLLGGSAATEWSEGGGGQRQNESLRLGNQNAQDKLKIKKKDKQLINT